MMKTILTGLIMTSAAFSGGASSRARADQPTTTPFGSWRSPITAQMLVEDQVRIGDLSLDGQTLYWVEVRPEEQGRYAIVSRQPDGTIQQVLPAPHSARTLVHEYGGGALLASAGTVYFSNFEDQRIWRIAPDQLPEPLTPVGEFRFANYIADAARNRLIAVCEDHSQPEAEAINRIVAVDLASGAVTTLVKGADFYSSPCLTPDGSQLAWLSWDHPNMPWDGTELAVARFAPDGTLEERRTVAGGDDESIYQPAWSPDGLLYFVSDRSNWWNLYRERAGQIEPVLPMEAEFAVPQWVFGTTTYGFQPSGQLLARYTCGGRWQLIQIDPRTLEARELKLPYANVHSLQVGAGVAFAEVSGPAEPDALVRIDLSDLSKDDSPMDISCEVVRRSSPLRPDSRYTSLPEPIEFPTENQQTAHAFYYPPTNADYHGPPGETPPLLIGVHGGPTSASTAGYRLSTQYWTSRGFAVCDVNYGGSTGYGREYRNRLRRQWGNVDVADAANAALYLASQSKADRQRLIIHGGSAGGYTTLAALAFRDVFACGASYYGVSDLALLAADTHKFEARYLDRLVGPYPAEEERYQARSPLAHLSGFDRPVILLQGLEDKVVPPNQAELILAALKEKGVPAAYVPFAGEQHGFRQAKNIVRAREAELYFYSRVLQFPLPEPIEPVEIFNLP